ncbi:MAG: phage tail assembly protein [Sphingomonadales bacterium]|nr:phage tail assembly protein [Sphingomonadales bacterium]
MNDTTADTPSALVAEGKERAKAAGNAPGTFETITLVEPITRGETTIEKLTLRKPQSGELRGLSLSDVIGMDITALLKLIPRISEPVLTEDECLRLDPADLTEVGGVVRGFFMTRAERQMMEALIAEQQPRT